jgi:mevalonate kinase
MKAIAPGKLILSGEHSVVYGRPALAMAIDLNAQSIVTAATDSRICIDLPDLSERNSYTLRALRAFKGRVKKNYHLFLNGELGIRDVLHKPIDLLEFGFIIMLDGLHLKLNKGLNLQMQSTIPIGCGLGSSAATLLSSLRAVGHYFRVDFKPEWYYEYSLEAERMQHGHPSGVDSYISLHGGCALFRDGKAEQIPLPRMPIHLVNTGTPESSTGECVEKVRTRYAESGIWSEFESVTVALQDAVTVNNHEAISGMIRENQRLLNEIEVVPEKVQRFITDLEKEEVSAKICGAGSIRGDAGGIVLVCSEQAPVSLCENYGYTVMTVRGDPLGTRIV